MDLTHAQVYHLRHTWQDSRFGPLVQLSSVFKESDNPAFMSKIAIKNKGKCQVF